MNYINWNIVLQSHHKVTWYRLTFRRIFDNDNKLTKVVGKVVDISSELRLKHQSITDPLTGTYNRLYITSAIQEYCHILKNNLSYACILIDIDYFKKINDTYGHIIGDRFLIEIVKIIKCFFRASDLIGRIGGDEFLIFIKDIYDKEIVREKADALIKKIHEYVTANNYPKEISILWEFISIIDQRYLLLNYIIKLILLYIMLNTMDEIVMSITMKV